MVSVAKVDKNTRKWKDGAAERNKVPSNVVLKPPAVWLVVDDEEGEDEEDDSDYYEDED